MRKIIKKILREQFENKKQLFDLLRTGDKDNIEMVKMLSQSQGIDILELLIEFFKENPKPPYFKILKHLDLSEYVINYILSNIFEQTVIYDDNENIQADRVFNRNGKIVYRENYDGWWGKFKYNEKGRMVSWEDSDGEIER